MPLKRDTIYFASDVHLGAPYITNGAEHEARFVRWLDSISKSAAEIYLLGDIFDFWWEYKRVVPRGFVRTLGKLAEITDSGVPVHFFIGNHDIWVKDYLEKEVGLQVHKTPETFHRQGKSFYLAHGDGLYDPSLGFKVVRRMFHSRILQKLFETFIHPDAAVKIGQSWSAQSRKKEAKKHFHGYLGEDKEYLVLFAKDYIRTNYVDFLIFGHRHIVLDLMLNQTTRMAILGDWIMHFSYGECRDGNFLLKNFDEE